MADRHVTLGQIFIVDVTAGINVTGRKVADQAFTCAGAGTFEVWMANGTTGTLSGTNVQGTPVALAAGLNTITTTGAVADGVIDITIGTAANTNSVNTYSASSGGACGASIPTSADNLYGDANSFTAASQVLTVNAALSVLDLDFTGSLYTPTFSASGAYYLYIYGQLTLISGMILSLGSAAAIDCRGSGNITTAGLTVNCPFLLNNIGGTWTLQDNFTSSSYIQYFSGEFNTNGKTITAYLNFAGANAKVLTPSNSVINAIGSGWIYSGSNLTISPNTATINCSGNCAMGNADYNGMTMTLTGATSTVSGSPTGLAAFNLVAGTTQAITGSDGTITAISFALSGSVGHVHTISHLKFVLDGWVDGDPINIVDFAALDNCDFSPSRAFRAGQHCTIGANVTGIEINLADRASSTETLAVLGII